MMEFESQVEASVALLRARGVAGVDTAVVLGTGLGPFADGARDAIAIPYAELPGFPAGEVSGHAKRLVVGEVAGRRVALLQGRAHYYERGDARAMAGALETLARIGVKRLVLTNAAGSCHADWPPGSLVVLRDHINFAGVNPLVGLASDDRFVPMTDAYDAPMRAALLRACAAAGAAPREGTYMWFSGPSFETPAEIVMASRLGADVVGMSTVPEVILARRLRLRVAALSLITNLAAGIEAANPSHGETKEVAMAAGGLVKRVLTAFLEAGDA